VIRPDKYHQKQGIEIAGEMDDALSEKLKDYPGCYGLEASGTWIIPAMANLPSVYLEKLQQCRYSENTIKTYAHYFRDFTNFFHDKSLNSHTKEEINNYLLTLIREGKISSGQQNQRINAIKFYYEKVLKRNTEDGYCICFAGFTK